MRTCHTLLNAPIMKFWLCISVYEKQYILSITTITLGLMIKRDRSSMHNKITPNMCMSCGLFGDKPKKDFARPFFCSPFSWKRGDFYIQAFFHGCLLGFLFTRHMICIHSRDPGAHEHHYTCRSETINTWHSQNNAEHDGCWGKRRHNSICAYLGVMSDIYVHASVNRRPTIRSQTF